MMKKLVITADDFGTDEYIDQACIEAAKAQRISAVSCFGNQKIDVLRAKLDQLVDANEKIGVGLHLNITAGAALTIAPSLTQPNGDFKLCWQHDLKKINFKDLENEAMAQFENLQKALGDKPVDHLSCHHAFFHFSDPLFEFYADFAQNMKLPLRSPVLFSDLVKTPVSWSVPIVLEGLSNVPIRSLHSVVRNFTKAQRAKYQEQKKHLIFTQSIVTETYGNTKLKKLEKLLNLVPDQATELMVHLANHSFPHRRVSGINHQYFKGRKREFDLIMHPRFQEFIEQNEIALVSFRGLIPPLHS